MKKSLAIICAIAVMLSALVGTFLLAGAADPAVSEVVMPTYRDSEGNPITLVGGEDSVPTDVAYGVPVSSIANDKGILPFSNLFAVSADEKNSGNLTFKVTPSKGKGIMFYLEVPEAEGKDMRIAALVQHGDKSAFKYNNRVWYTLSEGDTAWVASPKTNYYGLNLEGFKGYVYVPLSTLDQTSSGAVPFTPEHEVTGFTLRFCDYDDKLPAGSTLVVSAPVIVKGDLDTSVSSVVLPSADKVTDGENEWLYFGNETSTEKEPVYDSIPKDVSIAEVAEFKAPLTIGMTNANVPTASINTTVANNSGFALEVVPNVGISGRPAIKVTGGTGAADAELGLPTMYFYDNVKPATALMFYIDSTDAERKYYPVMGTKNPNGTDQYTQTYNGKVWIMADGETEWKEIPISAYYFTLPAGFKGSVKLDYTNYKFYYAPEVATVHQLGLTTVGPIADGDSITIGNPVHITRDCFNNKFILGSIVDANSNNVIGNVDGVVDIPVVVPPTEDEPEFLEGATELFAPVADLKISGSAGTATPIESICPVTDAQSVKVEGFTSGTIAQFSGAKKDENDKAIGVIVYFKTSTPNPEFKIATGAWVYGGVNDNGTPVEDGTYKWPATSYSYGQMYYLAKGATKWEQTKAASKTYHRQIPAPNGFEGYIYFPFNSSVAQNVKCESAIVEYVYAQMVTNTGDVEMSSWMNVKSFNADTVYATIGTEKCIDMLTGEAYKAPAGGGNEGGGNEGGGNEGGGNEGGNEGGGNEGGGNEGGGNEGGEGGETPEEQPDYKLPAYTGAAIDYSELSIQKVTVAKLKGVVTVGGDLTNSGVTTTKGGTITAVDSRNKLTNYPSFKINVDTGEVVAGLCPTLASFYFDTKVAPINPEEILYYIEVPSATPVTASISWNFYNANGAYYNIMYSGTLSMLKEGDSKWTDVKVSTYQFQIPANFKGYIKVMVKNIGNQNNSPAGGGKEAFVNDTTKWLNNTTIGINNLTSDLDVYVSVPLVVTKGGSIPYAAFVDGEENAARNIFTGAVLTRDDLKEFLGVEGSENLNKGEVPEIDYKIPAYTGAEQSYGNYLFARIRQVVLADNIAKGYIIPQTTFEDGHADKNNDYTKLVDSLVGISKMPFFSVTKSTGNPSESNVTVGTWHPKKAEQQNAKAGAFIQYLKMPSDLEKVFVGVYMNAYDQNFMAKNIAPYSGTVYYMEKGTTEWQTVKITAYWFELPKGFEGYVMWDTRTLKAQNGGDEWAADWTLYNWTLRVANLNNQTVVASAPFWADSIGDIDNACYLNDESKAVRDIFTGKVLKKEDIVKPLNIGDTIPKLPDYTTDFDAKITDEASLSNGTLKLEWTSIDNATKYVVRVFKKANTDDGIAYTLAYVADSTETTVTIEGLELNTQYAVVVYAYNAKNDEIAVFDYINASTAASVAPAPGPNTNTNKTPGADKKPTTSEEDTEEVGLGQTALILIIIGAAVLVLAAAAVVIIIVVKKRRARA